MKTRGIPFTAPSILALCGRHMGATEVVESLKGMEWRGHWPLVDERGRLTGETIADDDPRAFIIVAWDGCNLSLESGLGACSAILVENAPEWLVAIHQGGD